MACESTTDGILASKYLGGHSDLLAGVLVVKTLDDVKSVRCDMQAGLPSIIQSTI
jgi:cystathionine beta-lyase/cystathionine gamma-synthase